MNNHTVFKYGKRTAAMFVICALLFSVPADASVPLHEKYKEQGAPLPYDTDMFQDQKTYLAVLQEYKEKGYRETAGAEIQPAAVRPAMPEGIEPVMGEGFGGLKGTVFKWENNEEWAAWEFHVEEEGLYEIEVEYYLNDRGDEAVRSISVDGKVPFVEANKITFTGGWRDQTDDPVYNSIGDEIRPKQAPVLQWRTMRLTDSTGFYAEPFTFYFTKGNHTVQLSHVSSSMYIGSIRLKPPVKIPTYEEVKTEYESKGYKKAASQEIRIQAERPVLEKSHPTVRREINADPTCEPVSLRHVKLNVIGDWMWRSGNQSITWELNVPEDGLYKLGMRSLQHWGNGLPVYRQIAIDGMVPFQELLEYRIPFDREWNLEILHDENKEPFLFYLTKGTHTLTMTVKTGDLTEIIHSVNDDSRILSALLLKITMITGSNPDPNYEYELEKKIPDLIGTIQALQTSMTKKIKVLDSISHKRPAITNNFLQIVDELQDMVDHPGNIPKKLKDLQNIQSSLTNWYISLQDQPLVLDYIIYGDPDKKWVNKKSNIFQTLKGIIENLIFSFFKDYDNVGGDGKNQAKEDIVLNVWIGRGKEWAETLKRLAEDEFTPEKGIRIKMNVLPSTQLNAGAVNALMLAINSGNAPDAALCVSTNTPVEFAIRDAVVEFNQFPDFQQYSKNFLPGILTPFQYKGSIFGMPETMEFKALFYRKDIMQKLGIMLPDTWEDVYQHVLPVLYQNNMQMYIPADYTTFLYQQGGSYYTEDGKHSALDAPEAFRAFKEFTEVYTSYGVPVVADFYNRMRTGEMPIGIAGFQHYMTTMVAAPELAGKWAIAPVPGHKKPDGTIDRSVGGIAVDADIILSQSKYKKESWEFIKWWLSADTQVKYARDIEAMIGTSARWNPANIHAYEKLPWDRRDMEVIKEQWQWAKDVPNVLGGYFTGRHVSNAWNRVVLGNMSHRDSLEMAVESIDKELRVKQEEYREK